MDKQLKDELREFGLLPVSLDEKAQSYYKQMGRDPSTVESHYTPGTREDILKRQMAIDANVRILHEMDVQGTVGCADYQRIENQIRDDLGYIRAIRAQGLHIGCKKATGAVPLTYIVGINRDPLN